MGQQICTHRYRCACLHALLAARAHFRRTQVHSCTPNRAVESETATPAALQDADAMETDVPAQPM